MTDLKQGQLISDGVAEMNMDSWVLVHKAGPAKKELAHTARSGEITCIDLKVML